MKRDRQLRVLVVSALLALAACGEPTAKPSSYPVILHARTQDEDPLPGVTLTSGSRRIGASDAQGNLQVRISGREGASVTFGAECPKGSRLLGDPPALRLRTLANGPPPEVDLVCEQAKRLAALIVNVPGFPDLPVLVHDREVARTDATGTAHALLEGDPQTPMRVVLDTSARPRVVPALPHKDVQIGKRDDLVVFAPELTELPEPKKKAPRRKKEPPPAPVLRPTELR